MKSARLIPHGDACECDCTAVAQSQMYFGDVETQSVDVIIDNQRFYVTIRKVGFGPLFFLRTENVRLERGGFVTSTDKTNVANAVAMFYDINTAIGE